MRKAVLKLKSVVPSGEVTDVVEYLTSQLASASQSAKDADAPGARSVSLWMNKEAASEVQRWTAMNNSSELSSQASFVSTSNRVIKKLGISGDMDNDVAITNLTFPDLIWMFTESIYETIPTAVPSLALAVVLKFAEPSLQLQSGDAATAVVPPFCDFLCASKEVVMQLPDAACRPRLLLSIVVHCSCFFASSVYRLVAELLSC